MSTLPKSATPAPGSAQPTDADAPHPLEAPEFADPPDPWLGKTLADRFRVIERIGQGGMGTVYLAEHLTLRKQVALKIVQDETGDSAAAQRFVREAMVTSLIDHPNVISAIDFGSFENGIAYLAMQLVRGPTLGRVLYDEGCLSWARTAEIGSQIADALCAAQAQGVVHRDLKPDNVILQPMPDGTELVKLLDFGIAKHARDSLAPPPMRSTQAVTRIGLIVGTLGYMAPEQAVGKRADHRSDLYSLGALLWECVVGRKLWRHDDVQALLAEQLNTAPSSVREVSGDSSIPDAFDRLVARLLSISPADRPQHPSEVRDALRALVTQVKQGTLVSDTPTLERRAPLLIEAQATRVRRGQGTPEGLILKPPPPIGYKQQPPASKREAEAEPPEAAAGAAQGASAALEAAQPPRRPVDGAPTRVLHRRELKSSLPPKPRPVVAMTILGALALGAVTWLLSSLLSPAATKPPLRPMTKTTFAASQQPTDTLAAAVRPLMRSLVEGETREERTAAAQALLVHVPVDEVPAYGRAMAHLQLAETCARKKEQLETIAAVDDPRVLPALITLAQRKRGGCGPKGKDDCLSCLRDELEARIAHFERKQMLAPKTP